MHEDTCPGLFPLPRSGVFYAAYACVQSCKMVLLNDFLSSGQHCVLRCIVNNFCY